LKSVCSMDGALAWTAAVEVTFACSVGGNSSTVALICGHFNGVDVVCPIRLLNDRDTDGGSGVET
jgi:hypothetical protein